jgi:hypothetical protein
LLAVQHNKQVGKIDFAKNQAQYRHEDIIDQGSHNFPESGTYNYADCEVDYVPLKCKISEFSEHSHYQSSVSRFEFRFCVTMATPATE